jgi:hypothetical protein
MIGDFIGGSLLGSLPVSGGDRLFKVAEDFSPFPQDRFLFNYHHFNNAVSNRNDQSVDVDRFVLGFEKTFFTGRSSVELRVPFAQGLAATQPDPFTGTRRGVEFGDLSLSLKGLIYRGWRNAVSGGLSMTFPTGPKGRLLYYSGETQYEIKNTSFHLQPYLAHWVAPHDCLFLQSVVQLDFDTTGYDITEFDTSGSEMSTGTLKQQNLLYADFSGGVWLYRNAYAPCLNGIAGIVELHYTTTLNDAEKVLGLGNPYNRLDYLHLTSGLHFQLFRRSTFRVAASAPLRSGDFNEDRGFDAEVVAQWNTHF